MTGGTSLTNSDLSGYDDVLSGRYGQGLVGCIFSLSIGGVDRVIHPLGDDLIIGGRDVTECG